LQVNPIDDYLQLASQMRRGLLNSNATSSIGHTYNNHSILHGYGYPPPPHSLSMLSRPHPTMLGNISQTAHYALELAAATPTPPYQSRRLNADDLMAMRLSTTHDDFGTHGVAPLLGRNNNNPSQLSDSAIFRLLKANRNSQALDTQVASLSH